jgi:hypothetical protein
MQRAFLSLVIAASLWPVGGCGETAPAHGGATTTDAGAGRADGGALLADGTAGRICQAGSDACWPHGTCAQQLTGGVAFSLLAPPLAAPDGYCTAECSNDAQCGKGGLCFGRGLLGEGGECRRSCRIDQDCEKGQECAMQARALADAGVNLDAILPSTCQPLPATDQLADDEAGKACKKDEDCQPGYCAESTSALGGYCSGQCVHDADCGRGGACVAGVYGSAGECQETCKVDSDCQNDANGWGCGSVGFCVREPNPLPDGAVGSACTAANATDVCGPTGSCRTVGFSGENYPAGYCVGTCDEDSDCGAQGVCINQLTCLRKCSSDQDCRPEYTCRTHPQATAADATITICYPKP